MTALLSLGSNLGDRLANLRAAFAALEADIPHTSFVTAPVYETEPVDVPEEWAGQTYYNTAVVLETDLTPDELSVAVHAIEDKLGRKRTGYHAPRTIDIDIVAFGDARSSRPDLKLPHPEAASRRFVLQPLADIVPDFTLPGQTHTIAALLNALPPEGCHRLPSGGSVEVRSNSLDFGPRT